MNGNDDLIRDGGSIGASHGLVHSPILNPVSGHRGPTIPAISQADRNWLITHRRAAFRRASASPRTGGQRSVISCLQGPLRGIWLRLQWRTIDGIRGEQHEGLASGVGMRVYAVGCCGAGVVACPRA